MVRSTRLGQALVGLSLILAPAFPARAGSAPERPAKLAFSTYLGGSRWDIANDIAVDAHGDVWVTGTTASRDFPRAGPPPVPDPSAPEPIDGFLARLSQNGKLTFSAYLGGPFRDFFQAVTLDAAGVPWEVGFQEGPARNAVHLARRTALLTYTVFGTQDRGHDLAFDGAGNIYVLAATEAGFDIFVEKRSPTGQQLWVTGLSPDFPTALAVDAAGSSWVLGGGDLLKLDPAGHPVPFPVPLGISISDIAVDGAGHLHLTGTKNGDLYYAELAPDGTVMAALSFGGSQGDFGQRIALGAEGDVALLGLTESPDLPLVHPVEPACPPSPSLPGLCAPTPFVIRLAGTAVVTATYLDTRGGEATAVALGRHGDLYVAGWTPDPAFPVVKAFQPFLNGPSDAFVLRIAGNPWRGGGD
jgi:hypothetical protein